jgi:nickel transport protein
MRICTAFLATLLTAATAQAHDLWLDRRADGYELLYGHRHSGHSGQDTIEYKPDAVNRLVCFDTGGRAVGQGATASYPARLAGDCAVAYAQLSSGYWTKTPYGTKNVPKDQVEVAVSSWLSVESVKRIDHWGPGLARPLTQDLELVPLENPLTLGEGDKLRLLVTFLGQPAAKAVVAYDGKPRGETGPDGQVNVKVRHRGPQVIEATLRRPLDGTKADEEVHTSTLSFDLGGRQ